MAAAKKKTTGPKKSGAKASKRTAKRSAPKTSGSKIAYLHLGPVKVKLDGKVKGVWRLSRTIGGKEDHADFLYRTHKASATSGQRQGGLDAYKAEIDSLYRKGYTVHGTTVDATGAGHKATYYPDGMQAEDQVRSPYGVLGPRSSSNPRSKATSDGPGHKSSQIRGKYARARNSWDLLLQDIEAGTVYAKVKDGKIGFLRKASGKCYQVKPLDFQAVASMILGGVKGLGTFPPDFMPSRKPLGRPSTAEALAKAVKAACAAKPKASRKPKTSAKPKTSGPKTTKPPATTKPRTSAEPKPPRKPRQPRQPKTTKPKTTKPPSSGSRKPTASGSRKPAGVAAAPRTGSGRRPPAAGSNRPPGSGSNRPPSTRPPGGSGRRPAPVDFDDNFDDIPVVGPAGSKRSGGLLDDLI